MVFCFVTFIASAIQTPTVISGSDEKHLSLRPPSIFANCQLAEHCLRLYLLFRARNGWEMTECKGPVRKVVDEPTISITNILLSFFSYSSNNPVSRILGLNPERKSPVPVQNKFLEARSNANWHGGKLSGIFVWWETISSVDLSVQALCKSMFPPSFCLFCFPLKCIINVKKQNPTRYRTTGLQYRSHFLRISTGYLDT